MNRRTTWRRGMAQAPKATILDHFAELDDPRVERTRRHQLVAIDRKTARRSYDRAGKQGAIHMVSAGTPSRA